MKTDKTSRTAQYMALFRALESRRQWDDRLFYDPFAIHFLEPKLRFAVWLSKNPLISNYINHYIQRKIPGAFSSGLARTKYIDDLLEASIVSGVKQVILLGAGFDTRALRLDFMTLVPTIEIDHPNTSNFKVNTFKKRIGALPKHSTYCQIDFNKQSLNELAAQHNFDFTKPTTIIWEGVTNYLSAEAIEKTFLFISQFPKGSHVIFTYVHQDILTRPASFLGGEKLLKDLKKLEEQWTFGFLPEELTAYLNRFGLTLTEDLSAVGYREKYVPNRNEEGYEFYRVAIAKK